MTEHAWPPPPWRGGRAADLQIVAGVEAQMNEARRLTAEGAADHRLEDRRQRPAARARWSIDDCLMGYLPSTTRYEGEGRFDLSEYACAAVEPELAIAVGEDLAADASAEAISAAVGAVRLAAELVDIRGRFDDLSGVLARNIFHRAVVVGATGRPYEPGTTEQLAIRAARNGKLHWELPIGALIPDVRAVLSFVAKTAAARGHSLAKDQIVLSGVLTSVPLWARPGDEIVVSADGFAPVRTLFH